MTVQQHGGEFVDRLPFQLSLFVNPELAPLAFVAALDRDHLQVTRLHADPGIELFQGRRLRLVDRVRRLYVDGQDADHSFTLPVDRAATLSLSSPQTVDVGRSPSTALVTPRLIFSLVALPT